MRLQVPGIGHSGRGEDVLGDPRAKSAASTLIFVELNKQMIEYGVNNMHVICGFKTAFASKRGIISILCGAFKSFFSASNKQVDTSVFCPASSYQEDRKTLLKEQFVKVLIGLFGPQVEAGTVQKTLFLWHIPHLPGQVTLVLVQHSLKTQKASSHG